MTSTACEQDRSTDAAVVERSLREDGERIEWISSRVASGVVDRIGPRP